MKRLGLFFLLSVVTLFGAMSAVGELRQLCAPAKKIAEHKPLILAVYEAPKPTAKPLPKPAAKPKPLPKPKTEPLPKPAAKPTAKPLSKPKPAPEPESMDTPKAVSKPAQTAHSPQNASAPLDEQENYYAKLYGQISRYKAYPARARRFGVEGNVCVAFEIDDSGRIVITELEHSSGSRLLDYAALGIFETIGVFEAPPKSLKQRRFEIIIEYTLS